jgi:putative flippase GtrA
VAEPPVERSAATTWHALVRHQLAAAVATALDFGTMILAVERFAVAPTPATAAGATAGAIANFLLGRTWVFRHREGHWTGQAVRYALVSGASAGWNTLGEHLMHDMAHVPYLPARIAVAIAVSLAWNFPMHRHVVFRQGRSR